MTPRWVEVLALAVDLVIAAPAAIVLVECIAALWPRRPRVVPAAPAGSSLVVLVPAHNEEAGIGETVRQILGQLETGDRLIVIADNCTDATAARAKEKGAEVLERADDRRRGKGFALAHGLESLKAAPPAIIVIIDADTQLAPGSMTALRGRTIQTNGPVQAVYLLDLPPDAGPTAGVSAFAFLVKNLVRPAGLHRLGIPCQLLGTGMAIPWTLMDIKRLATGNIVEDMQLGIDLAIDGHPPVLCLEARVTGTLPSGRKAAFIQRTRWEHGHLGTLLSQAPRLLWHALRTARPALAGMALDLAVPPLALLCLGWVLSGLASLGLALRGADRLPAILSGITGGLIGLSIILAWARHARGIVPARVLAFAPIYALWKIPLYLAFLFKRQKAWVRTPREDPPASAAPPPKRES
ncbi:MAG TPA: glycosyltransferase family 2 protein [Planctomycetota bacterium]|nr:glycosyltransferase family 2 protein [Planctomycetota bacterium]